MFRLVLAFTMLLLQAAGTAAYSAPHRARLVRACLEHAAVREWSGRAIEAPANADGFEGASVRARRWKRAQPGRGVSPAVPAGLYSEPWQRLRLSLGLRQASARPPPNGFSRAISSCTPAPGGSTGWLPSPTRAPGSCRSI